MCLTCLSRRVDDRACLSVPHPSLTHLYIRLPVCLTCLSRSVDDLICLDHEVAREGVHRNLRHLDNGAVLGTQLKGSLVILQHPVRVYHHAPCLYSVWHRTGGGVVEVVVVVVVVVGGGHTKVKLNTCITSYRAFRFFLTRLPSYRGTWVLLNTPPFMQGHFGSSCNQVHCVCSGLCPFNPPFFPLFLFL